MFFKKEVKLQMKNEHEGMQVGFCFISILLAERLLGSRRKEYRTIRKNAVDYLYGMVERGLWFCGIRMIIILADGTLGDGQHGLAAIVKSGKPQWCVVITGVPIEAEKHMDCGILRTLSDRLHLFEKNNLKIMSILSTGWRYQNRTMTGKAPVDAIELAAERLGHYVLELIDLSNGRFSDRGLGRNSYAFAMVQYLALDHDKATKFVSDFFSDTPRIKQAAMLRTRALSLKTRSHGSQFQREEYNKAVYCIMAHYEDHEISRICEGYGLSDALFSKQKIDPFQIEEL